MAETKTIYEVEDENQDKESFEEVEAQVDDWMNYYNNDRCQWDLLKLSPKEYYDYIITGKYPLPCKVPQDKR